jgi:serine/threonine protein kinase
MGTTFGTPQYMAPEQFRGASNVDERADVFSMGCILFEMVTGRRAFDGTGVVEIYQQVANGDRPKMHDLRADCPPALEALVARMLAPDPDERIPSVRELVAQLDGDAELRSLVNPSFRTATPVSALTSERPVKKAVTLEPPGATQGPPKVVSVTPVEPRAAEPSPHEPVHQGVRGPELAPPHGAPNPLGDLVRNKPLAELSQDSRPSLVTFTDGTSEDASISPDGGGGGMRMELPRGAPAAADQEAGVSPMMMVAGLVVLFLVAAGLGVIVASL